jgi:hypothetical protein
MNLYIYNHLFLIKDIYPHKVWIYKIKMLTIQKSHNSDPLAFFLFWRHQNAIFRILSATSLAHCQGSSSYRGGFTFTTFATTFAGSNLHKISIKALLFYQNLCQKSCHPVVRTSCRYFLGGSRLVLPGHFGLNYWKAAVNSSQNCVFGGKFVSRTGLLTA